MARKPRDIGTPTVIIKYVTPTPELVEQTRRNLNRALDQLHSNVYKQNVKLTIDWGEKPEGYLAERVLHPSINP